MGMINNRQRWTQSDVEWAKKSKALYENHREIRIRGKTLWETFLKHARAAKCEDVIPKELDLEFALNWIKEHPAANAELEELHQKIIRKQR